MLCKPLKIAGLALSLWLASVSAWGEIDSPDSYVYAEVSVREATLDGMRQRLVLLQSTDYTAQADAALDTQTRVRVAEAYQLFGTTASAHAAYGTRHSAEISAWLDANPEWQERLARLSNQFRSVSDQLSLARRPS